MKIVLLSGCKYGDCGGAQRPPALARAFVGLGHEVVYHNKLHTESCVLDGVRVVGASEIEDADLCICHLPEYAHIADRLRLAGSVVVYDLLDDWDGFVKQGDMIQSILEYERELIRISNLVICSAPILMSRAAKLGARRTALVLNAGPDGWIDELVDGHPERTYDWVYSGYLFGSWLDWLVIESLDAAGLKGLVIGDYEKLPSWKHTDATGYLPHREALQRMREARVGIVPFKGELCRAVDPIKYYDYIAAGLWTVTTPDVEPLAGRPWVRMSSREWFADTVAECVEASKQGDAPGPEEIIGDQWDDRARQILDLIAGRSPSNEPPIKLQGPRVPRRRSPRGMMVTEEDCRLRVTWMAPASCNMIPPCPYCNNVGTRAGQPPLGADPQKLLDGFLWLSEDYGPLYLSVCYGEPMSDENTVWIIAELAKHNRIDIVSNLVADLDMWRRIPYRRNIAVAASFHPHYWSVKEFLRKRRAIENLGFRMGIVSVVQWPPPEPDGTNRYSLVQTNRYIQELKDHGLTVDVLTFWGYYKGVEYPQAFGNAEQTPGLGVRGRLCRSGKDYITVDSSGRVYRCYMLGEPIGSILDRDFQLSEGPEPCPHNVCPCSDTWQYWA